MLPQRTLSPFAPSQLRVSAVFPVVFALLFALLLPACSKSAEGSKSSDLGPTKYSMSEADQKLVTQKFPGAIATPTGLLSIVRQPGVNTTKPRHGANASVAYALSLLDGTFIEASKPGEPIRFPIGVGRVIRGWDEALLDMSKGEKRTLILPHYLAYGVTGSPPNIPPYATLVFEVELLDFK